LAQTPPACGMRVALIPSTYVPYSGGLERHVDYLAQGLARRDVEVEILTQVPARRSVQVCESDGVLVRRFGGSIGTVRAGMAPALWEHLRHTTRWFDVADVHGIHVPLAMAVARAGARRLVFTPHGPIEQLVRWPYGRATRALVDRAVWTVCSSRAQAALLLRAFSSAANRTRVIPKGVDLAPIQAAKPFSGQPSTVLSVGRLERYQRVDRAIAAMAGLDPSCRLVVIGDGPAMRSLRAYAADLLVSSRVDFLGSVPDAELYRWLRTASVLVSLAEQESSGLQLLEAFAAGVPAVASDLPVHREAASYAPDARVTFVPPAGSPIEIGDAICQAAWLRAVPSAPPQLPTWDDVVDSTLALYEAAMVAQPPTAGSRVRGRAAAHPLARGSGRG
jgi:glycosyltransferase involved in cell wall biosynthesis